MKTAIITESTIQYTVVYNGNSTRFQNFSRTVSARSEREAVEWVYQSVLDSNYFPGGDGTILDCEGNVIADPDDNRIAYDGGWFQVN